MYFVSCTPFTDTTSTVELCGWIRHIDFWCFVLWFKIWRDISFGWLIDVHGMAWQAWIGFQWALRWRFRRKRPPNCSPFGHPSVGLCIVYLELLWLKWIKGMIMVTACIDFLVGGLAHEIYFPYIGNNNPNWLTFFQRGWHHQPGMHLICLPLFLKPKPSGIMISSFSLQVDVTENSVCQNLTPK